MMKHQNRMISVLLLCLLAFSACTKAPAPADETGGAETGTAAVSLEAYDFDGAYLLYGGKTYDPSPDKDGSMTVIDVTAAGDRLCVTCHVSPKNNLYAIFDTAEKEFVSYLSGTNLIWHSDDIKTAVYAFWSGLYAYDGTELALLDLPEGAWIDALAFSDDRTQVLVTVESPDGTVQTETVSLP